MARALSGFSDLSVQEKHGIGDMIQNVPMGTLDLKSIKNSDLLALQRMLTPKMTKYVPHVPTPKQSAFLLLNNKEAFYGGAAGGGKSDALLMGGLQYVDVKGYAGIIFRKTYADLVKPGALIERAKEWLFPHIDVKWNDKDKRFEFLKAYGPHKETNSILQFGYLESANDRYNYQGGEYQFVGFDELTHIDLASYLYMFSRLRRLKNVQIPLRVRGASNPPDDDQGIWVKTRFIDEGPSKGRVFIPAGLSDNPYLDVEEYEQSLDVLDPVTRARLKDGNWEIVRKGNMFKRDWIEEVETAPVGRRKCRFWDMAASDEEKAKKKNKSNDPDFTAGILTSEYQGIYYIEDIVNIRLSSEKTQDLQKSTAISDGYGIMIREEQEPGSSGITLCDIKGRTIFKGYNYVAVKSSGDKATRANAASAACERGHVKILKSCRNKEIFYNQMESFPGGIHDDMVDAFAGGFTALSGTKSSGAPASVEKAEIEEDDYRAAMDFDPGYFSRIGY